MKNDTEIGEKQKRKWLWEGREKKWGVKEERESIMRIVRESRVRKKLSKIKCSGTKLEWESRVRKVDKENGEKIQGKSRGKK